jgi:vancomycin aglycone glucosyltransferase
MKVLVTPLGTYGDVAPLITYAKKLQKSGHDITFAITCDFEALVYSHKFPYFIIPFNFGEYVKKNVSCINKPLKSIFHFKKDICKLTDLCLQILKDKVTGFDQIVGSGLQFSAFNIAESVNIPYKHILHAPVWIPSIHHSPPLLRKQFSCSIVNVLFWKIFMLLINCVLGSTIKKQRRQLNLQPVSNIYKSFLKNVTISCNHELIQEMYNNKEIKSIPYLYPVSENSKFPAELEKFLHTDKPTAYVGFGSMPLPNTQLTYSRLGELSNTFNIKIVLQLDNHNITPNKNTENIFILHKKVNHLELFRKMSVIIHHGGAGTVHNACRALKPQVIIPFVLDQFYWKKVIMKKSTLSEFALFDLKKLVSLLKATIA